jgi:hypothetical protein
VNLWNTNAKVTQNYRIYTLLHYIPFSAKVKNVWSYTSIYPYIFMAWCVVEHKNKFNILLLKVNVKVKGKVVPVL